MILVGRMLRSREYVGAVCGNCGVNRYGRVSSVDLATKPSDLGLRITGRGPPHPTIGQIRRAPAITPLLELVAEVVGRVHCSNKIIFTQCNFTHHRHHASA